MDIPDQVLRTATLAADVVAIKSFGMSEAERTRLIIRTSLEALLGNGFIQITDAATWPEWIALDPPYIPFEL
jgi:hypothetical protein